MPEITELELRQALDGLNEDAHEEIDLADLNENDLKEICKKKD